MGICGGRFFANECATPEFSYLNRNVPLDALLRRIICLSKPPDDIDSEDEREFEGIIVEALLAGYSRRDLEKDSKNPPLISINLTEKEAEEQLNKLLKAPCQGLLDSYLDEKLFTPVFEVLAMEMIHFPGEQKLPHFKPHFEIESLPAYVVCRELDSKLKNVHKHKELTINLHKALLKAARTRRMKVELI